MKGELKMDVNDYLPLRDVVFNTLRQAILRGEMEPGERLMEIQLAQKLGVSRTPIREAIRKLELDVKILVLVEYFWVIYNLDKEAFGDECSIVGQNKKNQQAIA